jgi:ribosomal protein L11 methyltransferase
MPQSRFYISAPRGQAQKKYDLIETAFEDDDFPISILDLEDDDMFEVSLYFQTEETLDVRVRLEALLGGNCPLNLEDLPDIDWVSHSQKILAPVRAGRFVVHGAHDRGCAGFSDIAIEIDAAQAFGTGHHGTTSGCLEMLSVVMRKHKPRNVLDLGTGSGVLAIAAAKLARITVLATDIDPIATQIARENVILNKASAYVNCQTATGFQAQSILQSAPYDLIIANILAKPLMQLAPKMALHLAFGGQIILSGILASQRDQVLAAYRTQSIYHRKTLWRNGWVTLHLS